MITQASTVVVQGAAWQYNPLHEDVEGRVGHLVVPARLRALRYRPPHTRRYNLVPQPTQPPAATVIIVTLTYLPD